MRIQMLERLLRYAVIIFVLSRIQQQVGFGILPGGFPAFMNPTFLTCIGGTALLAFVWPHVKRATWNGTTIVTAFFGAIVIATNVVSVIWAMEKLGQALTVAFSVAGGLLAGARIIFAKLRQSRVRVRAGLQLTFRAVILATIVCLALLQKGEGTKDWITGMVLGFVSMVSQWGYITLAFNTFAKQKMALEGLSVAYFGAGWGMMAGFLIFDWQNLHLLATPIHLKVGTLPLWVLYGISALSVVVLSALAQAFTSKVISASKAGLADSALPFWGALATLVSGFLYGGQIDPGWGTSFWARVAWFAGMLVVVGCAAAAAYLALLGDKAQNTESKTNGHMPEARLPEGRTA